MQEKKRFYCSPKIFATQTIYKQNCKTRNEIAKLGPCLPLLSCERSKHDYQFKLMARSNKASTWRMVRCFSCCFNMLATDSGSSPCAACASSCSNLTSFNNVSTSLTKSTLKRVSSASRGCGSGP